MVQNNMMIESKLPVTVLSDEEIEKEK